MLAANREERITSGMILLANASVKSPLARKAKSLILLHADVSAPTRSIVPKPNRPIGRGMMINVNVCVKMPKPTTIVLHRTATVSWAGILTLVNANAHARLPIPPNIVLRILERITSGMLRNALV